MPIPSNAKTIIISIAAIAIAIIIYMIVDRTLSPDRIDEQEPVTCGIKKIFRYKYPSEAFPIFARDYNSEVSLTLDVLKRLSDSLGNAQIGVEAKSKVVELQEKLNNDNITFSTALRFYFINVNSDPCNDTLRQKFLAFTEEMSRRMLELRSATTQVTTIAEKGTATFADNKTDDKTKLFDTAIAKTPQYVIVKDSALAQKSIQTLDELLQSNKKFNKMVRVLPADRLQLKERSRN
jgi:hypothetical protein